MGGGSGFTRDSLCQRSRADLEVAFDLSGRADLEDRDKTRGVLADLAYLADRTGPVDRRDSPAVLTEVVTPSSDSDRVILATRGRLIGSSSSVGLDRLLVCGVAEAADGTIEGRWGVPEAN